MGILSLINRVCFAVCLIAIVVGASLSIVSIWSDFDDDLMWKGISTALVLFASGILTIVVNNVIGARVVAEHRPTKKTEDSSPPPAVNSPGGD